MVPPFWGTLRQKEGLQTNACPPVSQRAQSSRDVLQGVLKAEKEPGGAVLMGAMNSQSAAIIRVQGACLLSPGERVATAAQESILYSHVHLYQTNKSAQCAQPSVTVTGHRMHLSPTPIPEVTLLVLPSACWENSMDATVTGHPGKRLQAQEELRAQQAASGKSVKISIHDHENQLRLKLATAALLLSPGCP